MAELPKGLPATVKVGYLQFKLEAWERKASNAVRRYGECSILEQTIRVDFDHGRKDANTLLHELIHAIGVLHDLEDGMTEERFVTNAANGLCSLWRDNPGVFAWIGKILAGD